MPIVLRCLFVSCLAVGLAGCLSGGGLGGASLAPASAGVSALGTGLIGQSQDVALSGAVLRQALEAEYQALQFGRVGIATSWEADGYRGQVVPTQLYRVGSQDCRGYTHTVSKGGATTRAVGTACRAGALWTTV